IAGGREHLVTVDRDAAHRGAVGGRTVAVLPDQIAGFAVDGLHDVAGVVQIHDAVVHERSGLVRAAFVHRPDPLQLQIPDVVTRDLVEGTVIVRVVVVPNHEPVGGIRIAQ